MPAEGLRAKVLTGQLRHNAQRVAHIALHLVLHILEAEGSPLILDILGGRGLAGLRIAAA